MHDWGTCWEGTGLTQDTEHPWLDSEGLPTVGTDWYSDIHIIDIILYLWFIWHIDILRKHTEILISASSLLITRWHFFLFLTIVEAVKVERLRAEERWELKIEQIHTKNNLETCYVAFWEVATKHLVTDPKLRWERAEESGTKALCYAHLRGQPSPFLLAGRAQNQHVLVSSPEYSPGIPRPPLGAKRVGREKGSMLWMKLFAVLGLSVGHSQFDFPALTVAMRTIAVIAAIAAAQASFLDSLALTPHSHAFKIICIPCPFI